MRTRPSLFVLAGTVFVLPACGGADLGECPPGSEEQQARGRDVFDASCASSCHNSGFSGTDRYSAPSGLDWDDLGLVRDKASELYGEASDGTMPPPSFSRRLGDEQLADMRVWLACGAPPP